MSTLRGARARGERGTCRRIASRGPAELLQRHSQCAAFAGAGSAPQGQITALGKSRSSGKNHLVNYMPLRKLFGELRG